MAFEEQEQQDLILLSQAIDNYYRNPQAFTVDDLGFLKQEADRLGVKMGHVPDPTEASQTKTKIGGVPGTFARYLGQPFIGYLEGLTTFRTEAIQPENSVEGILRSIGHLGGFVAPFGVPHRVAGAVMKKARKAIPEQLAKEFAKKLRPHKYAVMGFNLGESAVKLGLMSAVSNWQEGVNGMVTAFFGGAEIGAGFHALQWIGGANPNAALSLARVMAGAIYSGLPSTLRDDTAPEQVYNYLLGVWFTRKHRNIEMDKQFLGSKEMHDFSKAAMDLDREVGRDTLVTLINNFKKVQAKIDQRVEQDQKASPFGTEPPAQPTKPLTESQHEQQMDYFTEARTSIHSKKGAPLYKMADDFGITKKSLTRALERIADKDYATFEKQIRGVLANSKLNGIREGQQYSPDEIRRIHNDLMNVVPIGKNTLTMEDRVGVADRKTGEEYNTNDIVVTPPRRDNKKVKRFDYKNALNDNFITVENTASGKNDLYKFIMELGRVSEYEINRADAVSKFVGILEKQGYKVVGSPSDNDKVLLVKDVYKNYKKDDLKQLIGDKWGWTKETMEKMKKAELSDVMTTYDVIDQIWGRTGFEYFAKLSKDEGANVALNEFTKRLQIPASRGISPPDDKIQEFNDFMIKRVKETGREKGLKLDDKSQIRTLVVDDAFFEQVGISKKDWIKRFGAEKDGTPKESLIGDGAEYLHPKLMKALNEGMGEDIGSNFGKWFTHTKGEKADGEYVVSIKSGTFKASPELTQLMEKLGVGRIVLSSAVKVKSENIVPVKLKWNAKQKQWSPTIDGKENYQAMENFVFNTDPQSMKFKFSAHEESAGGAGAVGMLQQMMNFMEAGSPASKALWSKTVKDQMNSVNDKIVSLTSAGGEKELERYMRFLMTGEERESLNLEIEQPTKDQPVLGERGKWMEKFDAGFQSAVNLLSPSMRKQTLQILTNDLFRRRLLRPMQNGGFFVIEPMLPDNHTRTFSGKPLKENQIILPKSVRQAVVFTSEGKKTLGDIIDAAKGAEEIDLGMLGARSPVSAVNAVKNLKLAGIREDDAYTAIVHPRVVKEIKGDFDADKLHVYWDMPKEVTDYFQSKAESQSPSKYIYETEEYKHLQDELFKASSIFNHKDRMMKAFDFVMGKKGIGEFANNISRYEKALTLGMNERVPVVTVRLKNADGQLRYDKGAVRTYRKESAERRIDEGTAKFLGKGTIGVKVRSEDPRSVREFLDAWLNTAVDSGKLGGLPAEETYRKLMLEKMFEVYDVPKNMHPDFAIFSVRDSKFWKEFTDFRKVISRDYGETGIGKELDFNEIVDQAGTLINPGLNVEHLVSQMNKSKKITLENYTKKKGFKTRYREFAYKFGLNPDFERQIRSTRKIGKKTITVERSGEYDRNLSRDVFRAALIQEVLPEVNGGYRMLQIRRHLVGDVQKEKQVQEYLAKVFKDIDPKIVKKVQELSVKMAKELPEGVDMTNWRTTVALRGIKTEVENFTRYINKTKQKQFLYLLDIPDLRFHHYGIGLEIKDVHGIPKVERGKAEVFNEMYNEMVGETKLPIGKQKSDQPTDEVVKEMVEPSRTGSSGNENPPEDKIPYVEWRNKSKQLDKFAENLKEYPDFASEENINSLVKHLSANPTKTLETLTYRELWGINQYFLDLKTQGLFGLIQRKDKLAINWLDDMMMPQRSGFKLRQTDREWIEDPTTGFKIPMSTMDRLVLEAGKMHEKMTGDVEIYEKLWSDRVESILGRLKLNKKDTLDTFRLAVMKLEGRDTKKDSIYKKKWGKVYRDYNKLPTERKAAVNLLEKEIGNYLTQFHKLWIKKLDAQRKEIAEKFNMPIPKDTGFKDFYFPHSWHRKDFEKAFNTRRQEDTEKFLKEPRTQEEIDQYNKKWDKDYQNLVERRWTDEKGHGIIPMTDKEVPELKIKLARDFSNMRSRRMDIQGYKYEPTAVTDYVRRAIRTFYMNELGMNGRGIIEGFGKKMKGVMADKQIEDWSEFQRIYIRDNIAQPSQPSEILKRGLYGVLSDKNVIAKWNSVASKVGLAGLEMKNPMDLVNLNNLDAKFNLASLLFSTKTFIANLVGGSANTIIYTGMRPSIDATKLYYGSDKDLLYKYFPEQEIYKRATDPLTGEKARFPKSNKDVIAQHLKKHGVIEEFLEYEAYLGKSGKGKELWKSVQRELGEIYSEKGKVSREDFFRVARKFGVSEAISQKAGFFMRISEKPLRAMSYLTGYMNAKNKGLPEEIAVAMGRKHIEATQYLYNNAFRPAFSRTNLGKILTRFQFWSWSSIKFRRELAQKARYVGFKPGSEQYEALKRMLTFDLFMLGMANMFMFSLFESALPPPYNYAQDTAQLLFGDEEDRRNAFFGTYGLNVILPAPTARIPTQLFKSILNNDWERFVDYHVWTWFPFGRFSRDVKRFALDTPAYGVEIFTGLPIHKITGYKKRRKKMPETPRPKGILTGLF